MNSLRGFLWQMNPYECALFAFLLVSFFLLLLLFFPLFYFLFFLYSTSEFIGKRCSVDLLRPFPYIVHTSPLMRLIKPSSHRVVKQGRGGRENRKSLSDRDRRDNDDKVQIRVGRENKKKCMYIHGQRNKKKKKVSRS
jgi:hypothetical protein